jgi:hypothetical protein
MIKERAPVMENDQTEATERDCLMKTPVEMDFLGFQGSDAQRTLIERHVGELERRFGGIVSGRVAVKAPDGHHRKGAAFLVSIRLKLPDGREVDVSRTPDADERHADFHFAVGDAFRRAGRQLVTKVERMQRE